MYILKSVRYCVNSHTDYLGKDLVVIVPKHALGIQAYWKQYIACFSPQNEFVPQKTTRDFSPHPPLNHIIWKRTRRSASIWKKDSCSQNKLFSLLESVWVSSLKNWHVWMLFSKKKKKKKVIKCWSYFLFKWEFEQMTKYFVHGGNKYFYYVENLDCCDNS